MNKKRSAAPMLQHQDGDGRQTVLPGFEPSGYDSTTRASEKQAAIAGLLMTGAENAVTLSKLAELTGRDTRTVRLLIQRDRANGFPICADNTHGYFLPGSDTEKRACVQSMRHRAQEIKRTADNIERAEVLTDAETQSGEKL